MGDEGRRAPGMDNVVFLDADSFYEVTSQDKVSVVFFLDGGHSDCRKSIPMIVKMAQLYGEQFNITVLDVVKLPDIAAGLGLTGVPVMMITRKSACIDMRRGALHFHDGDMAAFGVKLANYQSMDMDAYLRSLEG